MTKSIAIAVIVIGIACWALATGAAEQTTRPATQPAAASQPIVKLTHFKPNQMVIRSLWLKGQATGFLVGDKAVYALDNGVMQWKASNELLGSDYWEIAGGDRDHVFLTASVPADTTGRSEERQLLEWNRTTGKTTPIKMIPERGQCSFFDAQCGAYIEDAYSRNMEWHNIQTTTNGGNTWVMNRNIVGQESVRCLTWVSRDRLIVGAEKTMASYRVDEKGTLNKEWVVAVDGPVMALSPGPRGTMLGLVNNRAVEFDAATGREMAVIDPRGLNVIAAVGDEIWIAGDEEADVYRKDSGGKWALVKKFEYPDYPGKSRGSMRFPDGREVPLPVGGWVHWITPNRDGKALLIGVNGLVYRWDGTSDSLTCQALEIDNSAVEKAEELERAKEPTAEQFREFMALTGRVSEEQVADVMDAAEAKSKLEHWTARQKLAWVIEEFKRNIDIQAKHPTSQPTTHPATGEFGSSIMGLRFFSPTSGIAVTDLGILTTDGSLDRWKGVAGWDRPYGGIDLVGGSEKAVYIIVFDNGFALWRWTLAAALTEIHKLPHGESDANTGPACDFADDLTGAFAEGRNLMVTLDGAKTWVESPLPLDKNETGVTRLAFCGQDKIAITSGSEAVAMLTLDKTGHAQQQWRSSIFGRFGEGQVFPSPMVYDPWRKVIWVYSESWHDQGARMQAFNVADGKVVTEFEPVHAEAVQGFSVAKGRMYIWGFVSQGGGGILRIWDTTGDKPRSVAKIEVDNNGSTIVGAFGTPESDDTWILLDHSQLIKWDGKPVISYWAIKRRGPTVDATVLDAAEEHWPLGNNPSRREMAANAAAMHNLSPAQLGKLISECQTKRKGFANQRELILWQTKRALELKNADSASSGPAPATSALASQP